MIFRTLVVKLNLKTPGREDDDEVKLYSKQDYQAKNKQKNKDVTDDIIKGLGGRENILSVDNCFTRLRVEVKDLTQVNDAILKSTGANGVVRNNHEVQVIYGVRVGQIRSRVDVWLAQTPTGSNV